MFKLCYPKMNQMLVLENLRYFEKFTEKNEYTHQQFQKDYKVLYSIYCILNKLEPARCLDIQIYFKVKFFEQMRKIPFINNFPYTMMDNGIEMAIRDIEDLAVLKFEYISR